MTRKIETANGVLLSKSDFELYPDDHCDVMVFSQREVALMMSLMRYAEWEARWEDRDADFELVYTLEDKLLSTCNLDLQLTRIANALYTSPDVTQVEKLAIEGIVDEGSVASLMGGQDYTDELTEMGEKLALIGLILGV